MAGGEGSLIRRSGAAFTVGVLLLAAAACQAADLDVLRVAEEEEGYNCTPVQAGLAHIGFEIITNTDSESVQIDGVGLVGSEVLEVDGWSLSPIPGGEGGTLPGVGPGPFLEPLDNTRQDFAAGESLELNLEIERTESSEVGPPSTVRLDYSDEGGRTGQVDLSYGVLVIPEGETCADHMG